jgi:putative peptidoglycan lipid II flippase
MAFGVLAAGIVQCLWLIFSVKRAGVRLRVKRPEKTLKIKKLFKLMGPGVLGAGVMHVNLFVDLIIASSLVSGSISYLYYADRLNQLPLGMVGIAVGTALLPMLSKAISAKDTGTAQNLFNRALEVCLLLALPAAVALFVIPQTLVETLFERGAFDSADTKTTALVLMAYAIGMPAYIVVKVFSTAYWSQQDTLSPVKISMITTGCNIILSIVLSQFIGVIGIALSTGVVGWLQLLLLWRGLKKSSFLAFDQRLKRVIFKIIASALFMGAGLFALDRYVVNNISGILPVFILVTSGLALYGLAIGASGAIKLSEAKRYFIKL